MTIRRLVKHLAAKLAALLRSESGMTLPLLGISMVAAVAFVGIGIDTGCMQMVQSKLQFSLDAAGLAAGSTVSTTNLNTETAKYLNANFNGYMGATLTGSSVTASQNNTLFTLSATATLPTTFLGVVGINTITVTANSQISRAVTGLELVLVLDNTGSMADSAGGSTSKIQALQSAANTLISTLFNGQTTSTTGKLWVGIVPFSQTVNIGTSHSSWINANYTYDGTTETTATLDWGPGGSWAGCVDARQNGYDITDDPPTTSSTKFGEYYWTSDNLNTDGLSIIATNQWKFPYYSQCTYKSASCKHSGCATTCSTVTSCSGSYASCTATGTYHYSSPLNNTQQGPSWECPQQVTPMTNSATSLTTAVNAMTAQGGTIINEGLVWGWRMLSPRWQGQWGGTMNANGLPLAYNTTGMAKAIVLVTDGENSPDATYTNGSWAPNSDHTSYWFVGSDRIGSTNDNTAVTDLDNKTLAICSAMKAEGIYIYTIGLGTDGGINTAELQSCATAVNYYFASPTTSQLQTIFSSIGDSLSNLRVSK